MTEILRARAALLDMDGTLVDSTAVVERLWLAWAEPHGLDPETVLRVVHGRQGHQSMAILLPERDHAINLHENEIMLATEAGDVDGVVGIAGADRLLAALETVPHAIVTSANVALMTARMQAAGLTVPELAVTAENVSASKPDPEGFLLAARMLASLRPSASCSRTPARASRPGSPRACAWSGWAGTRGRTRRPCTSTTSPP